MNRVPLRGAQVITMAPNRPETERADILIEGDTIAAIGGGLDERGGDHRPPGQAYVAYAVRCLSLLDQLELTLELLNEWQESEP